MSTNLVVPSPINSSLQQVSAGDHGSPLSISSTRVEVTGGGGPPLFVQGSEWNYAMIGLMGHQASKEWQIQATNTAGSSFVIAYSQTDPKLNLSQSGDLAVTGGLKAALPTLPPGAQATNVVIGPDGRLYRQG